MKFRDLQQQYYKFEQEIQWNIKKVCASAQFICGDVVLELEQELAEYVGVKHCISCANGTDALTLALKTWGIGEGDAVFVPDFTFFSSGECPAGEGATPIFVDVDNKTYNMDPIGLEEAVKEVLEEGILVPKAVIAVDLFGQPADFVKIRSICERYHLYLLEDGAQGFGGSINGEYACSFGDISTTSFFPAKPLGCYGDGGAVFTNNDEWAALIRSYAVHGKAGDDKYNNVRLGMNSRLDTIQAAILQVKLKAFKEYELDAVNKVAGWYDRYFIERGLDTYITLPYVEKGYKSSWAQYTIQLPHGANRGMIQDRLKAKDIPTMVYYMKPMHLQGAFENTRSAVADCPITEDLCQRVLSLPMHPYMEQSQVEEVVTEISKILL